LHSKLIQECQRDCEGATPGRIGRKLGLSVECGNGDGSASKNITTEAEQKSGLESMRDATSDHALFNALFRLIAGWDWWESLPTPETPSNIHRKVNIMT
jgi:hypothetical protein